MNRKTHAGKSEQQKVQYARTIRQTIYEPTYDESFDFNQTDDKKKDLNPSKPAKKRKTSLMIKLKSHFLDNWLSWVIGCVAVALLYVMYESKIEIRIIEDRISNLKDDVKDVRENQEELREKLHDQDLKIKENQMRVESVEKIKN
ncbi:MAG: hypothetical protein WA440_05885 [Ignavibacteriaceae bacterium]